MKSVFADTSYYIALLSSTDQRHAAALEWSERITGRVVITEYVLMELGSALSRGADRTLFVGLVEKSQDDRNTVIVEASQTLFRRGLEMFSRRPDKDWSLTDCISFVVMKQRRLSDALTTDHHFEQAGFKALLK